MNWLAYLKYTSSMNALFPFLTYIIIQMSGPTVVFTTKLGAMGVAGAFAAAYANKKYPVMSQEQLQLQTIRNHQVPNL
jgi:hypothetical protein